jgi:hypothetical protein
MVCSGEKVQNLTWYISEDYIFTEAYGCYKKHVSRLAAFSHKAESMLSVLNTVVLALVGSSMSD